MTHNRNRGLYQIVTLRYLCPQINSGKWTPTLHTNSMHTDNYIKLFTVQSYFFFFFSPYSFCVLTSPRMDWLHLYVLFESVLCLLVSPQIHLPLKSFTAKVTSKRLVAGVFPAVCDKVRALTEGLAAHLTFVRFFTWI